MRTIITQFIFFIVLSSNIYAQSQDKGYIIEIEGTNIYLDYTSSDVKIGDRLQVVSEQKVMTHPVTKIIDMTKIIDLNFEGKSKRLKVVETKK